MPDSAQHASNEGDPDRVQSTYSDMAAHTRNEVGRGGRGRAGTDISGVDILPIPPALEFPYPVQSDSGPASTSKPSSGVASPAEASFSPIEPPKKSTTIPIGSGLASTRTRTPSPATPGLLKRIGSAPLRPSGPRKYGTVGARPRASRQASSFLQRIPSRKNHDETAFFDPAIFSDYEESSGEEPESDEEPHSNTATAGNQLQRRRTSPNRTTSSNPYKRFAFGNDDYKTRGHVSKHDGRLNISLHETANKGYLAKALGASLQHHLAPSWHSRKAGDQTPSPLRKEDRRRPHTSRQDTASTVSDLSVDDPLALPKLNIVVMVIGSRGDIQPFLRLGKILKEEHGHRVRIATHPTFKQFVEEDAKLEFFDVGGDPAELMAFMVKNPGLIPKTETLTSGEIPRRRAQMFEMFQGFWRACISSSDQESKTSAKRRQGQGRKDEKAPFVADAIIANPPCFAHIHCAERLGIPLHLMFTFPNTPTQQFPHPLTNIRQTNVDANYTNFMSYPLVEMMQWQGLGDLINEFRVKTLGLDPMSMLWAPGQLFRQKVPYSYLWSPGLIPKPADWGDEINITGFVFLDLASSFKPPEALAKFLDSGEPPVYIGFGSIVVDDPDKFTKLIFKAVEKAGVRALVSKGWGGIGGEDDCPDNIFLLDNTPHDWLFPKVSAVVHHGGAGTTAIGLKCGKPTMIVPFFGDQPFWGAMVAKSNAGAEPVPYKQLSADKLAESIKLLLTEEKQQGARALAEKIASEGDGATNAVKSFHKHLPRRGVPNMRCSILQDRVATWHVKGTEVRLSSLAAHILVQQRKVSWNDLRLFRVYDWNDFEGPGEPITGAGSSLFESLLGVGAGIGKMPYHWAKIIKQKETRERQRKVMQKERLRANAIKEDKATRKQDKAHAQKQAEAEAAKHERDPLSDRNGGEAGGEAKLPDGNQPDGLTQTITRDAHTERQASRALSAHAAEKDADRQQSGQDASDDTESETGEIFIQLAAETGRGLRKSGAALIKLPMEFFLALARGFHNAPRLYGDETVRTSRRITGIHSGCRVAASELLYGVFDGVTGVVRQPYIGAKYDGMPGFFKGVGKGAGGFLLKDIAAILGVPAYIMKGVHKEMTKYRQPTAFMRKSRIVEGAHEFAGLRDEGRENLTKEVERSWDVVEDVHVEISKTIKEKGLKGRVEVWRNRKWLKENGVMENVHGMQRALDAHREGRNWEEEFRVERERHQREQARALRARKEVHQKKYEKDKNGKRPQNPDVRMKTRHGALRSVKKMLKKLEGDAQDSEADVGSAVTEAVSDRPRAQTNMAGEATGTAAIDQVLAQEARRDEPAQEQTTSPRSSRLADDATAYELSPTSPRRRGDSSDTLVQSNDADASGQAAGKRKSPGDVGPSRPIKLADVPLNAAVGGEERRVMPRMATA